MGFEIGQIFEGEYPPEAAVWCNTRGDCSIQQVDGGYQIVENPTVSLEILAENTRSERDRRLTETDYLMMPDYPISPEDLALVKTYRQALRDVPQQEGFPEKVTFPELPNVLRKNSTGLSLATVGI